jgi:undecaprenyl-diphosphatase
MLNKSKVLLTLSIFLFGFFAFYDSRFVRNFDLRLRDFILSLRNESLNELVLLFTHVGDAKILGALCMISVTGLFLSKRWTSGFLLLSSIVVSYGLNLMLKNMFERERPINYRLIQEDGFSFPSGNAMVGTTFYLFAAFLIYQRFQKNWILVIGFFLPFLLGLSRIYVGVHYPSDIFAGYFLGIILSVLLILMASKSAKNRHTVDSNDKKAVV